MSNVKVVSFDLEGTLVTPDFSQAVWHEGIPFLYARKNGMSFETAKEIVRKMYDEVGDQRREWYDIKYWFERFRLGDYRQVMESNRHRQSCYPEVMEVLPALGQRYELVVATGSAREFLPFLLNGIEGYFARVFSSVSDYGQVKNPEFYLRVCQEMGIESQEMVHVGDSWQYDFLAAKETGIEAFHLDRGRRQSDGSLLASLKDLRVSLPGE